MLMFLIFMVVAVKFDCSEEDSKYYMEEKLAR
jgi:hypothetical protein